MTTALALPERADLGSLRRLASLASVLCCPETKTPLQLFNVKELRSFISEDDCQRLGDDTIGAFLSRATGKAHPVSRSTVSFLPQDAVLCHLGSADAAPFDSACSDDEVKREVKEWYDRFGWKKNESGHYNDSAVFSQAKPVGHGLYELLSHLSVLDRLAGGEFVLDAASGAIAHPEYMAFSWHYQSRVCVDMSITALGEARAKLRQADFCCLADICMLPFRDSTFDGVISGYTIQHIPAGQQTQAIQELYRVVRPGAHLCIFSEVVRSPSHARVVFLLRALRKVLKTLRVVRSTQNRPTAGAPSNMTSPHALYFFPRTVRWWREMARNLTPDYAIESLRLLDKPEFEQLFGQSNGAAKGLRLMENAFPAWTAGMCAFCLIAIKKPVAVASSSVPLTNHD